MDSAKRTKYDEAKKKKLSNRLKLFFDVSRYFDRFGHLIFSF